MYAVDDEGTEKLEVNVAREWAAMLRALEGVLEANGMKRKCGRAPKGPIEREMEQKLKDLEGDDSHA